MDIFDFITPEEIDELPDHPQQAFTAFARIASRRLAQVVKENDDDDRGGWQVIEDARYGFTNVLTAAAKRFAIQPFADYQVPKIDKFDQAAFRQYKADLDHYITQIILEPGRPRDTIAIESDTRDRLRAHLAHLKGEIEKSTLPADRKQKLIDKLAAFEQELDQRRISLAKAAGIIFTILGVPGSVWASGEVVHRLTHNVAEMIGQSQRLEEEIAPQLASPPQTRALSAPRPPDPPRRRPVETFPADLDDEIPF